MSTVYLCGGINGLNDADAKDWREMAKEIFHQAGLKTLDPMRRDYRGKEQDSVDDIVEKDKFDIENSNLVLVNATKPSWGTAMEVMYTYLRRAKPKIVAFGAGDKPSPWLVYHTVLYPTLEDACRAIIDHDRIEGQK